MVGEVLTGWDRAVGAGHAILPRILALLQTIPAFFVKKKQHATDGYGQNNLHI